MIWEPFVLALFLGLIVSAGLYFAYLWPSVEPVEPSEAEPVVAAAHSADAEPPATEPPATDEPAPDEPEPDEHAEAGPPS